MSYRELELLQKACEDTYRKGLCRMDCDSGDWCAEVEQEVRKKEARNDQGRDARPIRRIR